MAKSSSESCQSVMEEKANCMMLIWGSHKEKETNQPLVSLASPSKKSLHKCTSVVGSCATAEVECSIGILRGTFQG